MFKKLYSAFFLCAVIVSFLFAQSANCPSVVSFLMPKNFVNVHAVGFNLNREIDLTTARKAENDIISNLQKENFGSLKK